MQAAIAILPKLDGIGRDSKASPKRWSLDRNTLETLSRFGNFRLEGFSIIELRALPGHPGAELAFAISGREVRIGFVAGYSADGAPRTHLHARGVPMKHQCSARVLLEIARLLALEVCVEHETARIEALEQDESNRRVPLGVRRGQRTSAGLERLARLRTCILARETPDRVVLFHGRGSWSRCLCAISAHDPVGSSARYCCQ